MQAITPQFAIDCFYSTKLLPSSNPLDDGLDVLGVAEAVYLHVNRPPAFAALMRESDELWIMTHAMMKWLRDESRRWMRSEYGGKYTGGLLFGWYCAITKNYVPSYETDYSRGEADGVAASLAVRKWYREVY